MHRRSDRQACTLSIQNTEKDIHVFKVGKTYIKGRIVFHKIIHTIVRLEYRGYQGKMPVRSQSD